MALTARSMLFSETEKCFASSAFDTTASRITKPMIEIARLNSSSPLASTLGMVFEHLTVSVANCCSQALGLQHRYRVAVLSKLLGEQRFIHVAEFYL